MYICIFLSIYLAIIYLSIYLSIYLYIYLFLNFSIFPSCLIYPLPEDIPRSDISIYLSACLSIYESAHLSIYIYYHLRTTQPEKMGWERQNSKNKNTASKICLEEKFWEFSITIIWPLTIYKYTTRTQMKMRERRGVSRGRGSLIDTIFFQIYYMYIYVWYILFLMLDFNLFSSFLYLKYSIE